MAAKLSGGGGGKYDVEQNSEINVTPFVDVMLVLLIIFMVAAPLATVTVEVELPTACRRLKHNPPKPVYISIQSDGERLHRGLPHRLWRPWATTFARLIGTRNPTKERIFIRADKNDPLRRLHARDEHAAGQWFLQRGAGRRR